MLSETAMIWLWAGLLVGFLVLEAVTVQLVSIWFAVGALGALIARLCGASVMLQVVLFAGLALLSLIATRPLVKKFVYRKAESTNADRNIGATAVVLEPIDNVRGTGQAQVNGMVWTARSTSGAPIPKDALVTVDKIEGVKLMVTIQPANSESK